MILTHSLRWLWKTLAILILISTTACSQMPGIGVLPTSAPTENIQTIVPSLPPGDYVAIADGRLIPQQYVSLSFLTTGLVSSLLIKENDQVQAGQVLATLEYNDTPELVAADLASARLELLTAQKAFESLFEDAPLNAAAAYNVLALAQTEYDLMVEEDQVFTWLQIVNDPPTYNDYSNALYQLSLARDRRDNLLMVLGRYSEGMEPVYTRALIDAGLQYAQMKLADAQKAWEEVKDGPSQYELELAQARVDSAESRLAAAEFRMKTLVQGVPELISPINGTVVSVSIKEGELASPGKTAVVVADLSRWMVETDNLSEDQVVNVYSGQRVSITPQAIPDLSLVGVVDEVSGTSFVQSDLVTYPARILVDGNDPRLRWGMTVLVTFERE